MHATILCNILSYTSAVCQYVYAGFFDLGGIGDIILLRFSINTIIYTFTRNNKLFILYDLSIQLNLYTLRSGSI